METAPQAEHAWLEKLVGEWAYELECSMEPGGAPTTFRGVERVRSIGGLWVVAEGEGEVPGKGTARTLLTLGFDPAKKRYVGTWVGSMMAHLWVYEGVLDPGGTILPLETAGPNMGAPDKTAKYKDVIEFLSDDHRTLTSHMQGEDGKWERIMTVHYRRQ